MDNKTQPRNGNSRLQIRLGLLIVLIGLIIYLSGTAPEILGLNRSLPMGYIQIAILLSGLGIMCFGGFIISSRFWIGTEKSIVADIGQRLVDTGYLIAVVTGGADLFGLGTHPFPLIPYFGPLQAFGVLVGEVVILAGFLMMIPYSHKPENKL